MTSGQKGRESLRLTRKEQQLLELLEGNPGRCFSRPFLLKTIWGYSDKTKTRTVDVHVSRLRKKLQGRRNVAIHTVVRQGYVLEQGAEFAEARLENGFSRSPSAKIAFANGKSLAVGV
jgi:DNA-binding response OmpR family regulator